MQVLRDPVAPPPGPPDLRIERVPVARYAEVQALNQAVFGETRVIFRLDRRDLLFLVASLGRTRVGYKVGYGEDDVTFYSAKGGVLAAHRRRGVARALLYRMMDEARALGYRRFAFDTFPNRHAGMTVLGLAEGFTVTAAGYNAAYKDYRIRFEKAL
jgi:GNAT superfamily N-acetyltransferase